MPKVQEDYPFNHNTWAGEDPNAAPEYQAQMALPVHLVGSGLERIAKINPLTGRVDDEDGETRMVHTTACGLILGAQFMRSTELLTDVTCEACL